MKNAIISIIVPLLFSLSFATLSTAKAGSLMIIINRTPTDKLVMEYPSETDYKVLNIDNIPVKGKKEETVTIYEADNYQLIIYPAYKESPDIFEIENQPIKILNPIHHSNPEKFHQHNSTTISDCGQHTSKVTMEKLLVKSKQFPEEYNCVLTLSNGIVFSYIDGEAAATFYDEILDMKGNYIFESKLGTTKLSYNSKNGQVWYVFEPKTQEE